MEVCDFCGVNHSKGMADLSDGMVARILHAVEAYPWQEWPISGDKIARQHAGLTGDSLFHSVDWEDDNDE